MICSFMPDASIWEMLEQLNKKTGQLPKFEVLYKKLGLSRTIRFLNQYSIGRGNYSIHKEKVFKDKTVQDIVNDIQSKKSSAQTVRTKETKKPLKY